MAINTLDQYIAANKQRIGIMKSSTATVVAGVAFSMFDRAGNPGPGVLAGTTTTSAILQTDLVTGYPSIDAATGITSYLSKVEFGNSVASRLRIVDVIAKSGAYSYATGTTTLLSYPDITARCPDFSTTTNPYGYRNEIWIEVSTAFVTGTSWQVYCTYTNAEGVSGRTTQTSIAQAAAGLTVNKLFQLALKSGDSGVRSIQSVTAINNSTLMTAGAFNVLLVRQIWTSGRVKTANDGDIHDMLKVGLPPIYPDSALALWVQADSTSTGAPEVFLELAYNT